MTKIDLFRRRIATTLHGQTFTGEDFRDISERNAYSHLGRLVDSGEIRALDKRVQIPGRGNKTYRAFRATSKLMYDEKRMGVEHEKNAPTRFTGWRKSWPLIQTTS